MIFTLRVCISSPSCAAAGWSGAVVAAWYILWLSWVPLNIDGTTAAEKKKDN